MSSTKQRILEAAIELYNNKGVGNVTMRDIAASVGISPGNLAYHYKNQDFIIEAVFRQMKSERDELLMGVQQIPTFENINRQMLPLLETARKYLFFHLDTVHLIRNYPVIARLQQSYYEDSINYVRAVLDYSVGSGNLQPEQHKGQYKRLAHTVWMLTTFWLQQLTVRGLEELDTDQLRMSIWDLVLPYLTDKGRHHFQRILQPAVPGLQKQNTETRRS